MAAAATATTTTAAPIGEDPLAGVIHLQQGITRKLSSSASFTEIPTIDVSGMYSASLSDRQRVAAAVRDACARVGFMQIHGHGVDWTVVEDAWAAEREFFALPTEEKMKLHISKNKKFQGYEPLFETNYDGLKRGGRKEAFSYAYEPENDPDAIPTMPEILRSHSMWPPEALAPGYRARMIAYQQALLRLARRLLRVFALALDLPETHFDAMATYPKANVRSLYYPPTEGTEADEVGLGAHTDIEFFTIIAQTPTPHPALEVLNTSGHWIKLTPLPQHFVVNLGDMMQRMTNDRFLSTVHRVVNRGNGDRYSLPFFFGPNPDELIAVLPGCVAPGEQPRYEPVTTLEHANKRLRISRHKHPNAKEMVVELPREYVRRQGVRVYPDA